MNANELFYVFFSPVIAIIIVCIFGAFYFLTKKIEDALFFLLKKLFFIEVVTFKCLLGIGFIVLCLVLIIKFLNCDTIIEKFAPCNPTDSAQYVYNVVNALSGIVTPFFTFIALFVAYKTYVSQKEQTDKQLKNQEDQYRISNFENHLFQMIEQQHKLEEKVVKKYGSFRELYKDFCVIYVYVRHYALHHFGDVNGDKWKKILLKITYYIFYFGADEDFMCDKTFQILTGKYKLDSEKLKALILNLNGKIIEKKLNEENYDLFHTQKSEELGIYYRNLFNAIRYIDWECPDEDKKEYYAKLVRTNISDFAQLMLYYNMQGERGSAWLDKDEVKDLKGDQDGYYYSKNKKDGKLVLVQDCLLTKYKPIKNSAISVKQLDDNQIPEIHQKNELYQKDIIHKIPDITEKAEMNKKLDIDPRNDEKSELFSDDVIDYELKIGD